MFSSSVPSSSSSLVLLFIISSSSSCLALLGVLSLHTAGTSTAIWRAQGEVNVLLAVQSHHKGWDVHHLLAHTEGRNRWGKVSSHACINAKVNSFYTHHHAS